VSPQLRPDGRPEELAGLREERRSIRASRLATGSLACPMCDAPAPLLDGPATPATPLWCPYCDHAGRLHEFLSLSPPQRAPRVNVFVRARP
jgi:hypothetical protein